MLLWRPRPTCRHAESRHCDGSCFLDNGTSFEPLHPLEDVHNCSMEYITRALWLTPNREESSKNRKNQSLDSQLESVLSLSSIPKLPSKHSRTSVITISKSHQPFFFPDSLSSSLLYVTTTMSKSNRFS